MISYVTCAGVRVPDNCTIKELEAMLEKRNIRFDNEKEIVDAFTTFLNVKKELGNSINLLIREKANLQNFIGALKGNLTCPKCREIFTPLVVTKSTKRKNTKK